MFARAWRELHFLRNANEARFGWFLHIGLSATIEDWSCEPRISLATDFTPTLKKALHWQLLNLLDPFVHSRRKTSQIPVPFACPCLVTDTIELRHSPPECVKIHTFIIRRSERSEKSPEKNRGRSTQFWSCRFACARVRDPNVANPFSITNAREITSNHFGHSLFTFNDTRSCLPWISIHLSEDIHSGYGYWLRKLRKPPTRTLHVNQIAVEPPKLP